LCLRCDRLRAGRPLLHPWEVLGGPRPQAGVTKGMWAAEGTLFQFGVSKQKEGPGIGPKGVRLMAGSRTLEARVEGWNALRGNRVANYRQMALNLCGRMPKGFAMR
jgi:hypothetical protein